MIKERVIDIKNVSTGYGKSKIVSKNLNLSIDSGEFITLIGPNGCGKSTLFRTISGLQNPISGDISIMNHSLNNLTIKNKAKLLSLVLTDKIDAENIRVYDIVSMGRYPYVGTFGTLSKKDKDIVFSCINSCGISHLTNNIFTRLSDGEKQRVMIARALAQQTPIILLDEPTAHLDIPNKINIIIMLQRLAKDFNKSIVTITHDLDLALSWSDRVWLMNKQGVVFDGVPEDIVLKNLINEVFKTDRVEFDINSGNFSTKNNVGSLKVALDISNYKRMWLLRALSRNEICVVDNNSSNYDFKIYDDGDTFVIEDSENKHTTHSVEELLDYINKQKNNSNNNT